jgi:hypothetical protein
MMWLDNIHSSGIDKSILGSRPLSKVENDEKRKVLQAVGRPAGRRGRGSTNVFDNTLWNLRLSNEGSIFLALGKILDQATCPTDTFRLARSRLGSRGRVGKELLKDAKKTVGVVKRSNRIGTMSDRGVLHNGGDASLEERKIHETNAAEVRFLLVFRDNLGQSSNNIVRGRS